MIYVIVAKCCNVVVNAGNLSRANLTIGCHIVAALVYTVGLSSVLLYSCKGSVAESGKLNVCSICITSCAGLIGLPALVYTIGSLSCVLNNVMTKLGKNALGGLGECIATIVSTHYSLVVVAVLCTGGVNSGVLDLNGMLGSDMIVLRCDLNVILLLVTVLTSLVCIPTDNTGSSLLLNRYPNVTGSKNSLALSLKLSRAGLTVNNLIEATVFGTGEGLYVLLNSRSSLMAGSRDLLICSIVAVLTGLICLIAVHGTANLNSIVLYDVVATGLSHSSLGLAANGTGLYNLTVYSTGSLNLGLNNKVMSVRSFNLNFLRAALTEGLYITVLSTGSGNGLGLKLVNVLATGRKCENNCQCKCCEKHKRQYFLDIAILHFFAPLKYKYNNTQ